MDHTQMSRKQTDGGMSQLLATLVWTHSPKMQKCDHDLTITLRCPEIKQMEV